MNYVKMMTVSVLLLAVPAANAWTEYITAPFTGTYAKLVDQKNRKTVKIGGAAALGLGATALYFGVKPVREGANATASGAVKMASKLANQGKRALSTRKGKIIAGTTLATATTLGALWYLWYTGKWPFTENPFSQVVKQQKFVPNQP